MKRFFRELKASLFITSIICIALGIALVAKPDVSGSGTVSIDIDTAKLKNFKGQDGGVNIYPFYI